MKNVLNTDRAALILGDSAEVLRQFADNSVNAIVCDPPAGIGFMNREWDGAKGGRVSWVEWLAGIMREALRVMKPGAHGLVWALPRTSHWTATALEEAGFEIRDRVSHIFGTGFPKSLDVSKAIDKAAGAVREVVGPNPTWREAKRDNQIMQPVRGGSAEVLTTPATAAAAAWDGWGTALKPACEDWWLIRKPFDGTVAYNVLKWGTGGLNIDECRIGINGGETLGRWPANVILSHAPECVAIGTTIAKGHPGYPNGPGGNGFHGGPGRDADGSRVEPHAPIPDQIVELYACAPWCAIRQLDVSVAPSMSRKGKPRKSAKPGEGYGMTHTGAEYSDAGGPSRFFYCAKPSRAERDAGLEHIPAASGGEATDREDGSAGLQNPRAGAGRTGGAKNTHPTVKATELMEYLVRLVTPPGGVVLDPFAGSGSTGIAAVRGGFRFIGIEKDEKYAEIARGRIEHTLRASKES